MAPDNIFYTGILMSLVDKQQATHLHKSFARKVSYYFEISDLIKPEIISAFKIIVDKST